MRILPYSSLPAEFRDYDPDAVEVVHLLQGSIASSDSQLRVDHIGSTSVPGCGGKGIIDLAVLYPEGLLTRARTTLDTLGFQKQSGPEPFPEDRPMRVGCVEHNCRRFQIHAHVIALDSEEYGELVWFRERLRRDPALEERYEERKQAILANIISRQPTALSAPRHSGFARILQGKGRIHHRSNQKATPCRLTKR